jgi:hypothetical protein
VNTVAELPKWNDECSDVAKELFGHLDRNKDGKLDTGDLAELEKADLDFWAGEAGGGGHLLTLKSGLTNKKIANPSITYSTNT